MIKILIAAVTIDGKISRTHNESIDWTSKEDKRSFFRISKEAGVIIMGKNTFNAIGKALPGRLNVVLGDIENNENEGIRTFSGDIEQLVTQLDKEGFEKAIIGGGSNVYTQFLEKNLIDEMYITHVGTVFGKGIPLFGEIQKELKFEADNIKKISSNEVLVHYIK